MSCWTVLRLFTAISSNIPMIVANSDSSVIICTTRAFICSPTVSSSSTSPATSMYMSSFSLAFFALLYAFSRLSLNRLCSSLGLTRSTVLAQFLISSSIFFISISGLSLKVSSRSSLVVPIVELLLSEILDVSISRASIKCLIS